MKRWVLGTLLLGMLLFCGCKNSVNEPLPTGSGSLTVRAAGEAMDFGDFSACAPGQEAREGIELVEAVLAQYPAGLMEQLGPVEILLVGELTGEGRFEGGHYAGFTQRVPEGWRMVLDAERFHTGTVHHEMAHILDGILTEAGALAEEEWMGYCPSGFSYGQQNWEEYGDFFVDAYAMTDLKEDRASVFEAAVMGGEGAFAGKSALWLKLYCFSGAIRAHFDTTLWPATTIWELALK